MGWVRILIAVVVAGVVGGCGGSPPPAPPQSNDWPGAVISADEVHGPDATRFSDAGAVRRVTYVSKSGVNDAYAHVTASIYVPQGTPPQGGFPVIAYGRAVAVPTPDCAFSSPAAVQTSTAVIDTFLKAGYVVTVPDYQGLGTPSDGKVAYHPTLDSASAGYNLIDAVRATRKILPQTSSTWLAVGDAQGGQGAWAVNELSDDYGHPDLRGTVSISPIADVDELADTAAAGTLTPVQQQLYIEYLAALATQYGGQFPLDDYRRGTVKDNWDLMLSCKPGDDAARSAALARVGPDDLRPATPKALALLRGYLRKTTLPQGPAKVPMLVVSSPDDPLAPAPWTQRALARACHMGDAITIVSTPSPTLTDPLVLDWMASRSAGKDVVNDCPTLLATDPTPPPSAPTSGPESAAPTVDPPVPAAEAVPDSSGAGETSLISGWLPIVVQVVAVMALIAATGWRNHRWRVRWLPVGVALGAALVFAVWWFFESQGWGPKYPWPMWPWIGLTGLAMAVLVLGWRGSPWWRRTLALVTVPLCVLATATAVNASLRYLPTVGTAWQRVSGKQPAQWIDLAQLSAMQQAGARPTRGTVVSITTPSGLSGFSHRDELVYLPPAWFSSNPPPPLPVVMMIGPEFSTPPDWLLYARGLDVLDKFALLHHGAAPVVAFPDTSGSFTNDTECVNGPRGNAADHVTKEFVPYVISHFGVNPQASGWGVAGWSTGGTCSAMMLVTHPELFDAIIDLDGQLGPNAGPKNQTIARLFGGDPQAWAAFDPKTVVQTHGPYRDKAAWIGVSADVPTTHIPAGSVSTQSDAFADWDTQSEDHSKTAKQMCSLFGAYGIECSVVGYMGGHDYRSAAAGFAAALPWLAGRLATPGVPTIPLPGA
jgi:S-formylglutathione hydrolase FrmB